MQLLKESVWVISNDKNLPTPPNLASAYPTIEPLFYHLKLQGRKEKELTRIYIQTDIEYSSVSSGVL